jgi:ribosomal protein S18 acetylase RimI-like enzyme
VFRLSAQADPAFLAEMLYEAVNWLDDGAEERPPMEAMLAVPQNARYVDDWGRAGDVAISALDRRDEPVGAAWLRRFDSSAPGYGYVADDIPELAIGVYPEFRGQRVGTLLMGSLIARAERDHVRGISLSVHPDNPAKRLYARNGFEVVNDERGALVMLLTLA